MTLAQGGARRAVELSERGFFERNGPRWLRELCELLRFPSVSAEPSGSRAMFACAERLRGHLRALGAANARILPGRRHPTVFGRIAGPKGAPRVLIYGHYDVQPAEPLSAWRTRPFEPVLENGRLYARGASDDKGQLFAHFKALELLRARHGALPVNVSFLIDGEEEIGSPSLPELFDELRSELACDVAIASDTPMLAADRPSITHALRGICTWSSRSTVAVVTSTAARSVARSRMRPKPWPVRSRSSISRTARSPYPASTTAWQSSLPPSAFTCSRVGPQASQVRQDAGGAPLVGEAGYTSYERATIRPSLEISGLKGGYLGAGVKGVIPASASAKLDIRWVQHQNPSAIRRSVSEHVARSLPLGVSLRVRELMRVPPIVIEREQPAMRAAVRACQRVFGVAPVFLRAGGSIAVVSALWQRLRVPTVLLGFGLPSDGAHAPNEHFSRAMLDKGIRTSAAFLEEVAA